MLCSPAEALAAACFAGRTMRFSPVAAKRWRLTVAARSTPPSNSNAAKSVLPSTGTPLYSCKKTSVVLCSVSFTA